MLQNKIILGSEEWFSFPDLKIPTIKARVDSGAKTSALHAINISPFLKDGNNWVKFDINPIQKNLKTIIHCEAPLVDKRIVKSSSGFREQRYVIQTTLGIGAVLGVLLGIGATAIGERRRVQPNEPTEFGNMPVDALMNRAKELADMRLRSQSSEVA